ncbi:GIY-YIG nuclease family protein [Acidocella sp. MX-AZ02]|uniref:GIY-YIG nuclease family protein n=1 Tax=Acidocella sp. MX-AZ02 TaxID=1214225 RepID=UPI000A00B088|nr:GIY-YIG nuclease family protein [Acidocella sp. MX-AZ02]
MRDRILSEIRRISQENGGKPPGKNLFETETGITEGIWRGRLWAKWSDAIIEAGFEPNVVQPRLDPNFFFTKLAKACLHYGKMPSFAEIGMFGKIDPEFPSRTTFEKKYGSKSALIERFNSWLRETGEFPEVLTLIASITIPPRPDTPTSEGYVYLIQSGGFYKIGRSDDIERRIKEIRIALPDTAKIIHNIKTDDPAGIEAYWHRRFASRRANGEWFKLSSAEISAFKKRKYQ